MTPFPGSEGLNSPLFSELSDLMELFLVKVVITVIIIIIDIIGSYYHYYYHCHCYYCGSILVKMIPFESIYKISYFFSLFPCLCLVFLFLNVCLPFSTKTNHCCHIAWLALLLLLLWLSLLLFLFLLLLLLLSLLLLMLMLLLYNYEVYPISFLEVSFRTKDWVSFTVNVTVQGAWALWQIQLRFR